MMCFYVYLDMNPSHKLDIFPRENMDALRSSIPVPEPLLFVSCQDGTHQMYVIICVYDKNTDLLKSCGS
jgi:hypothetical protein